MAHHSNLYACIIDFALLFLELAQILLSNTCWHVKWDTKIHKRIVTGNGRNVVDAGNSQVLWCAFVASMA